MKTLISYFINRFNGLSSSENKSLFSSGLKVKIINLLTIPDSIISRLEFCYSTINMKYFNVLSQPIFSHPSGD